MPWMPGQPQPQPQPRPAIGIGTGTGLALTVGVVTAPPPRRTGPDSGLGTSTDPPHALSRPAGNA